MTTILLLAGAGLLIWLGSLYLHPWQPCLRCTPHAGKRGGGGRNAGSRRRKFGACARCQGTGKVRRPGARILHKTITSGSRRIRARSKESRP